jgi:hypothetical protein
MIRRRDESYFGDAGRYIAAAGGLHYQHFVSAKRQ